MSDGKCTGPGIQFIIDILEQWLNINLTICCIFHDDWMTDEQLILCWLAENAYLLPLVILAYPIIKIGKPILLLFRKLRDRVRKD